jgi:hypothetical protein
MLRWLRSKSKRAKFKQDIAYNQMLIQKAYPLAKYWKIEIMSCKDPVRAERILNHIRRIDKVQLRAQARLKSYY